MNGLYINLSVGSSVGEIVGYQILSGLGAGFLFQTPIFWPILFWKTTPPITIEAAVAMLRMKPIVAVAVAVYINLSVGSSVGEIVGYQILSGLGAGFLFQTPIIGIDLCSG
jgi:hypothetical protein